MKDLAKVEDLHWGALDDKPYIGMLWKNWRPVRGFYKTHLKGLMYDWKKCLSLRDIWKRKKSWRKAT